MFGIGVQELVLILLIILILFGSKKLPELSRSVGDAIRELRHGMSDSGDSKKESTDHKKKSA